MQWSMVNGAMELTWTPGGDVSLTFFAVLFRATFASLLLRLQMGHPAIPQNIVTEYVGSIDGVAVRYLSALVSSLVVKLTWNPFDIFFLRMQAVACYSTFKIYFLEHFMIAIILRVLPKIKLIHEQMIC